MYNYVFDVEFVCGLPAPTTSSSILTAIAVAASKYNNVIRKVYKHLAVSINASGGLTYNLTSSIPISPDNLLRSCQFFSKELAKERTMKSYIKAGRMLKK